MTTGTFRYIDPATVARSEEPFIKPWAKVDTDVTSFTRTERRRSVTNLRDIWAQDPNFAKNIDTCGFAVYKSPSNVRESVFLAQDDNEVRAQYYTEVEQLLREKLGPNVQKVVIFDHTIRRHDPTSARQPVQQVHVDQTPKAAETRVRRHLPPGEVEGLLQQRYQLINVWRPIGHPATDFPLAVIDWRTTKPEDLVKVDLLYPKANRLRGSNDDRGQEVLPDPAKAKDVSDYEIKGETYSIAPNKDHKFYYVKDMTPEEAMFIKCFDSQSIGQNLNSHDAIAALTPHTAFIDPNTPEGTKGRQSIEVRCLVFYNN